MRRLGWMLITMPLTRHQWGVRMVWMVKDRMMVRCECQSWRRAMMLALGW